jgi:uncharacterized protein (TIGR02246 family)
MAKNTPSAGDLPSPQAQGSAGERAQDEYALRALLGALTDAWNKGDAEAFASHFTPNSDYIAFNGLHLKGARANADAHRMLFEAVLKDSELVYEEDIAIRFLTADVAVMIAKGSVRLSFQHKLPADRRSIQTYVAVKQDGVWRFAAFQNTRINLTPVPKGFALRLVMLGMRARAALSRLLP